MPIIPDEPYRPPERPDTEPTPPDIDPTPPSDDNGYNWEDPGLLPDPEPPTYIPPEPEPEPEPEPVGFLLSDPNELMAKYQTYGGVGANCRTRSSDWADMASMPYWLEGSINATMSGSTMTLSTDDVVDSWRQPDSVSAVVAPNSYVELSITYSAAGANAQYQGLQDDSFSFSVVLEDGDSLSASVGSDSVNDFSIIKNGVECLNYSEFASANAVWSDFTITLTIDKAVHCAYAAEAEPSDDFDDDEGGNGAEGDFEWTQDDSWMLLGVFVLFLLATFVWNSTGGEDCEP
jgi:hypothetical protein